MERTFPEPATRGLTGKRYAIRDDWFEKCRTVTNETQMKSKARARVSVRRNKRPRA